MLWGVALLLRVIYFLLAVRDVGLIKTAQYSPDALLYQSIADSILSGEWHSSLGLLKVGPGYGLLLAAVETLTGSDLVAPVILNLLLGSLAPVLVCLLARELFENRAVALVAGAIGALSLSSIALSSQILTDQPFFTIHAGALLAFVRGIKSARHHWFLAAGALGAWGACVKSAGEPWIYLFAAIILVMPRPPAFRSRLHLLKTAGLTVLVMFLVVCAWSLRNQSVYGIYTFGTNGLMSMRCYLMPLAVSTHTPDCELRQLGLTWSIEDGDNTLPPNKSYARARQRVGGVLRDHPGWVLHAYVLALHDNIRNSNIFLHYQLPSLRWFSVPIYRAMEKWLGYLIVAASLVGLGLLISRRQYFAALLLGSAYTYFTFIVGFSFSQGSRLHYPAEMAWSPLVAYTLVTAVQILTCWLKPLRRSI